MSNFNNHLTLSIEVHIKYLILICFNVKLTNANLGIIKYYWQKNVKSQKTIWQPFALIGKNNLSNMYFYNPMISNMCVDSSLEYSCPVSLNSASPFAQE